MSVEGLSESAASIRHLIRTVAGHGLQLDEGPSAGVPIFSARVSLAHAGSQWERAVRAFGPDLPLRVAQKRPEDHISPLYFAAMSCRTLGEVVQLIARHWAYATDGCRMTLIRRGRVVQLRLDPVAPSPLGARLGIEYLLADLARSGRELSGGVWRPVALVLGHRSPIALDTWEQACGVPTRFDPTSPGLVMSRDSLEQPVRSALPPASRRFFLDILEWLTPRRLRALTTTDRLTAMLTEDLGATPPPFDEIARRLAMSTRSLRRRLAAERTSYQQLLDTLRRDEAVRRVADDRDQVKVIARAVGFSDPRAFRRAFKRWTGLTPQRFRDDRPEASPVLAQG